MGKNYDVILLERIENLGSAGDQKSVKKGFAFNFLIPRGLALPVNADTLNRLGSIKKKEEKRLAELKKEVDGTAKSLEGKIIKFEVATTDDGKLYGSIDASDVAKEIETQFKLGLDKKLLSLKNPIKEAGETQVSVNLHPELQPEITVIVEAKMTEAQKKKLAEKEKVEKEHAKKLQEAAEAEAQEDASSKSDDDDNVAPEANAEDVAEQVEEKTTDTTEA